VRLSRAAAVALSVAVLLASGCGGGAGEAQVEADPRFGEQPNFVFVLTDDQNLAQFNRRTMPETFRLLARRGTLFENHVATTPLCCPSRASMLTGQYAHNHGVLSNTPGYGALEDPENTLPTWLQRAGYRTAYLGKWMNGYEKAIDPEPHETPPPGWDEWYGLVGPHGYNQFKVSDDGVKKRRNKRGHLTRTLNKHAVAMVHQLAGEEPFYLEVGHLAPHVENTRKRSEGRCSEQAVPAPRDSRLFENAGLPDSPSLNERDVSDKPDFIGLRTALTPAKLDELESRYECRLASLRSVDRGVGQLTRALAVAGELKDTVFIVGSDNGTFHGEHRLPGGKGLPYEEAAKIPLLVRAPPKYRADRPPPLAVELPTANIDLVPTIVDLAGAPTCMEEDACRVMDGRSLVPLLGGKESAWPRERPILTELTLSVDAVEAGRGTSCRYTGVFQGRWLYVSHASVPDPTGTCVEREALEQYDLARDPFQLENLASAESPAGRRAAEASDRLERLVRELADCAGIEGRDPEPASGHYCR